MSAFSISSEIFLNMTSKNGSQELVSLLRYMKDTTLDSPEILVKDERIIELDRIVREVKEGEEWIEQGIKKGIEQGIEQGENRLSKLDKKLLEQNRLDDLRRSLDDIEYRKKLYEEYRI